MSEEMVFRLIIKPWNSRVLLAGTVQWRRNPEATPPGGAVKQTQTGIFTALPCLQSLLPRSPTLTSPPRPLLRFGKIPSLTGSIQVCPLFYQWLAGASLTWSNPSRRQGLGAHNQWYVDQVTPRPSYQFIVQGFQLNCPSTNQPSSQISWYVSVLSFVFYKILVQLLKFC